MEPGQVLNGRYRLERLLGKGGMGQVYLSNDLETDSRVALKTLSEAVNDTDRRRFEREIRALRTLEHPHIVTFRDLGRVGDHIFYTMDYLPGVTLEQVIESAPPVTTTEHLDWILGIMIQVTQALGHLHSRRFVHRDVKPSNILLCLPHLPEEELPPPEEWIRRKSVRAVLTDFGLVKSREDDVPITRTALGTPHYMSPEQVEASPAVDERTDLYSLGVILYRACAGKLPFQRLSEVLSREPAVSLRAHNSEFPELLVEVAAGLLEYDPFRRPANAAELTALLRAVLERQRRSDEVVSVSKVAQPAFCGREPELDLLKRAAHDSSNGHGRWVAITGERGTGKSWLVSRSAFKTSVRMNERLGFYFGTFTPSRPHSGFQEVIISHLHHIHRLHGADAATDCLGRWGRHLASLFPRIAGEPWFEDCPAVEEQVPDEILKERVFETVVRLLTGFAEVEPRVIVLEDLHYGDELDIELLRRLIINCADLPVLVVTTHRHEVEGRLPLLERLLKEIRVEERLMEIEMQPFAAEEARAMISSMLVPARDISDELVDALVERTDGVPLYLLHLINSLWNRGIMRLEDDQWRVDPEQVRSLPIPESTRSHFLLVLDEIPADERKVLNVASILGTEFSFELLLEVTGMDEFELDGISRNLVHAGIIEEHQDGFRFLHSFEREIVLSCLSKAMRRRLHARVGKILEELHGDDLEDHIAEIAEHYYLGSVREKGADYLQRAARQARQRYAPRAALDFTEKALELVHHESERRTLLVEDGDLHKALGEPEPALARYQEANLLFSNELLHDDEGGELSADEGRELSAYARLLLSIGEVCGRQGDTGLALENLEKSERMFRRVDDQEGIAFALARQGGIHLHSEDFGRADEAYRSAVSVYQSLAPSTGLVNALVGLGLVERMRGNLESALDYTNEALRFAQELGDEHQSAKLLNTFGNLHRFMGRMSEAVTSFEQSIEIRERLGDRQGLAICLMNLGRLRGDLGDSRSGLEALDRARELFQAIGDQRGQLLTLGNLGQLHLNLGDFARARELFEQYLGDARRLGAPRVIGDALTCLGMVILETEEPEAADELFRESLEFVNRAGDRPGEVRVHVQRARVQGRLRHFDEALRMCAEIREQAQAMEDAESLADTLRVAAETHRVRGDLEEALELAQSSLEHYESLHLAYSEGLALRTLAKIYRDQGYYWADQSSKFFDRAMRRFEMLGARFALAVTQVEYGIFLVLVEEHDAARELFQKAERCFEELDVMRELIRVRRELAELRGSESA